MRANHLSVACLAGLLFSGTLHAATVTLVGNLQSELGAPGDWNPAWPGTHMVQQSSGVFTFSGMLPDGNWEYKVAINDSWDINYGLNAQQNGPNIPLTLGSAQAVKFYYDDVTHWVTDNVNSPIVVAAGSFQSELGAPGDWDPSDLRTWLQDPDGDGLFTMTTTLLPPGAYEFKVALYETWDENYGLGGAPNGPNVPFVVLSAGDEVTITYDGATHVPSVNVVPEPWIAAVIPSVLMLLRCRRHRG